MPASEVKLQGELDVSRPLRSADHAPSATDPKTGRVEDRRVGQIDEISPQREFLALREWEILLQAEVQIAQPGSSNHAVSAIAEFTIGRYGECAGIYPLNAATIGIRLIDGMGRPKAVRARGEHVAQTGA